MDGEIVKPYGNRRIARGVQCDNRFVRDGDGTNRVKRNSACEDTSVLVVGMVTGKLGPSRRREEKK